MRFISFFPQLTKVTNDISASLFLSYVYVKAQYSSNDVLLIRKYSSKQNKGKSWEEDLGLSTKVMTRILKTYSKRVKDDIIIPKVFESMPQYYIPRIQNVICRLRDSRTGETLFEIAREEYVQYIDNCIATAGDIVKQPRTLFIDNDFWCGHISELTAKLEKLLKSKYKSFTDKQVSMVINLLLLEQKKFRQSGEYLSNTDGAITYTQVFSYIENRICKLPKQIAFDLVWITLEDIFGERQERVLDKHHMFTVCNRVQKIVKACNIIKYINWLLENGYTFFDFFKEKIAKEFANRKI